MSLYVTTDEFKSRQSRYFINMWWASWHWRTDC